jgi:signal transduction histidine kinase
MSVAFRHHRLIQGFKKRLKRFRSHWFDPSSLGTQLSLSMMTIVMLQWLGFALWTKWVVVHGMISIPPLMMQPILNQLLVVIFITIPLLISLIYITTSRTLRPLAQLQHWNTNQATPILKQLPKELRELANICYHLSTSVAETQTWQRQFTTQISHELRTPLSLVYGYLQSSLRRRDNLTEFQQEALQTAMAETEHTLELLKNLLMFARSQSETPTAQSQSLELYPLLLEAIKIAQTITQRTIHLQAINAELVIWADRTLFTQMILHLIQQIEHDRTSTDEIVIHLAQTADSITLTIPHAVKVEGQGLHLLMVQSLVTGSGGQLQLSPTAQMDYDLTLRFPQL